MFKGPHTWVIVLVPRELIVVIIVRHLDLIEWMVMIGKVKQSRRTNLK
jgi:hypothetical protein